MVSKSRKTKNSSEPSTKGSAPVSLRVRRDHLAALDKIAEEKGTVRAAQIQTAIAEYIQRGGK